jgi:hypothetical protein
VKREALPPSVIDQGSDTLVRILEALQSIDAKLSRHFIEPAESVNPACLQLEAGDEIAWNRRPNGCDEGLRPRS